MAPPFSPARVTKLLGVCRNSPIFVVSSPKEGRDAASSTQPARTASCPSRHSIAEVGSSFQASLAPLSKVQLWGRGCKPSTSLVPPASHPTARRRLSPTLRSEETGAYCISSTTQNACQHQLQSNAKNHFPLGTNGRLKMSDFARCVLISAMPLKRKRSSSQLMRSM